MTERIQLAGIVGMIGGILWAVIPLLDDLYPIYLKTLAVVPVLLILAVYGIWTQYSEDLTRVDVAPLVVGFGVLTVVALWNATISAGNLAATFAVGVPAILGLLLVGIGSLLLAYRLRHAGCISRRTAILFALALPLDPLFNALVTPLIGTGLSLYGFAWFVVGVRLWQDAHRDNSVQTAHTAGNSP